MSYASVTASAKAMLGRMGRAITLTRKGQGAIDPIAGTRAAGSDVVARFNCVGLPPGHGAEDQIGTLVGRRLMQFYMARTYGVLDPAPGDIITWNGVTYTLIWSAVYDPDASGTIFAIAYGEAH